MGLIQVPSPLRDMTHEAGPAHSDLAREHRPEPVDPEPHTLMANIDPALMEKVFDVPKRERKAHAHQHRQLDDLWRCFEMAKWRLGHPLP